MSLLKLSCSQANDRVSWLESESAAGVLRERNFNNSAALVDHLEKVSRTARTVAAHMREEHDHDFVA